MLVHSLQSATYLNGKRGAALCCSVTEDDRFQVKVEGVPGFKAIRPKNLKISHAPPEDEPHPDYMTMVMHQMTMETSGATQSSAPRLFRSAREYSTTTIRHYDELESSWNYWINQMVRLHHNRPS